MIVHHCHIRKIYQLHLVTYYPRFLKKIEIIFSGTYISISSKFCCAVDNLVDVLSYILQMLV